MCGEKNVPKSLGFVFGNNPNLSKRVLRAVDINAWTDISHLFFWAMSEVVVISLLQMGKQA